MEYIMKTKSLIKKVRPLGNLTDTYYTLSTIDNKTIDGVVFLPVFKLNPEVRPLSKQTIFWMRKDNMEYIK